MAAPTRLLHRSRLESELEEELQYHLDREIQRNLEAGMPRSQARRAAVRSIGRAAQIQEECRDQLGVAWIAGTLRDLRYGLRSVRRTAVFSVADALLLKALPVHDPERLFQVFQPDGPGLREYGVIF